jgi:hypothetical protein
MAVDINKQTKTLISINGNDMSEPQYDITFMNQATLIGTKTFIRSSPIGWDGAIPTRTDSADTLYTFLGWNTNSAATTAQVLPVATANATYYAIFTTKPTYTVTWRSQDNTSTYATSTHIQNTKPTYPTATMPTKNNTTTYTTTTIYKFNGWSTATNQENGSTLTTYTTNQTFYAAFSATTTQRYIINFNRNGADIGTNDETVYDINLKPGYGGLGPAKNTTTVTNAGVRTVTTYKFLGWSTNSAATTASTIPNATADATYYAIFESSQLIYYEITFVGPTTVSGYILANTFPFDRVIYPVVNGNQIFIGWATTSGATTPLSNLPAPSAPATYYAVYQTIVNPVGKYFVGGATSWLSEGSCAGSLAGSASPTGANASFSATSGVFSITSGRNTGNNAGGFSGVVKVTFSNISLVSGQKYRVVVGGMGYQALTLSSSVTINSSSFGYNVATTNSDGDYNTVPYLLINGTAPADGAAYGSSTYNSNSRTGTFTATATNSFEFYLRIGYSATTSNTNVFPSGGCVPFLNVFPVA